MRVAIIGDYPLDPGQIWGGEQAAFSYLVRALCRIPGLEVHVLTVAGSASSAEPRNDPGGAILHALPRLPHMELIRRYPVYRARVDDVLARIRPDVVHAQGAIHHGLVALASGYPAVITVHGVQSEDCKHQRTCYLRLRKRFTGWWIERHNLRHTRYLIAISRYVTTYFSRFLRPDVRVYHIPNAIDGRFFEVAGSCDGSTILYAGRVIQRKRVLDLVKAFAMVAQESPGARLRIAGEARTEADYFEEIRGFVRQAGLEEKVAFLGSLPEDFVLREFANCDVLALPSAQETTPMVIAQAMAASKPIVATPVGGVAEMVRDGETGILVPVGDVESLAEALARLLRDAALRARMGEAGRDLAVRSYRADSVAARTFEVYREVAETAKVAQVGQVRRLGG